MLKEGERESKEGKGIGKIFELNSKKQRERKNYNKKIC